MKSSPFSSIITKMNGGNYEMWAMQVKRTLIAHDKEHLILEPDPVQKVGKYTTWFKDNSLVMVWIVGTLTQEIANEVLHKESAKDMWDSLAVTYSQARNETRIMQLHHDIHQMRQDGRPLHTYYSSLKSMFERLNSYFPACKCEQQKAYRDMLMVGVFLSGLDSLYESAKNQMLTSPLIPPIDEAYSRLSRISIPTATIPDTTSVMLATRGRGGSLLEDEEAVVVAIRLRVLYVSFVIALVTLLISVGRNMVVPLLRIRLHLLSSQSSLRLSILPPPVSYVKSFIFKSDLTPSRSPSTLICHYSPLHFTVNVLWRCWNGAIDMSIESMAFDE
ncbi:hypothetical protein EJ110_NYTH21699 [Nymphaea thermarum]|nr:hypothetical protein EJ110_NYTH21699 [Nymphaea thermarum]